ncbi:protein SSUH2 homolog isoform X5 [Cygnus olor]|uniref:protein SSUH2 homolog isoform X5 n=1 Tax=Cygnus olor TaxID=8869 RepID=UPI001ADE25BF|nr:protein SSUH2 homolog isoform X5 [Cygnus olor]
MCVQLLAPQTAAGCQRCSTSAQGPRSRAAGRGHAGKSLPQSLPHLLLCGHGCGHGGARTAPPAPCSLGSPWKPPGAKPVAPPLGLQGELGQQRISPPFPQPSVPPLTEAAARRALLHFVAARRCYGSRAAAELVIRELRPHVTYRYRLETFSESRLSEWAFEPFTKPGASTPPGDIPPDLWDVEVGVPPLFQGQTRRCRVPRSALVRECHRCHGRGRSQCGACHGAGRPACRSGERKRRFCFCTVDMGSDLRHEVQRVVCCLRTCSALCLGLPNGREGWTQGARAAADLASSLCLFCYTDISKDSPKMYCYCTKIAA